MVAAKDTIAQAMRVIRTADRWTQGARARDRQGNEVPPRDRSAVQWCSIGAVEKVSRSRDERDKVLDKLAETSERLYGCSLEDTNDLMGYPETMRVFKTAKK